MAELAFYGTGLYSSRAREILDNIHFWLRTAQYKRSWTTKSTRALIDNCCIDQNPSGEVIFKSNSYYNYYLDPSMGDKRQYYLSNILKQLAKHFNWTWKRSNIGACTLEFNNGKPNFEFTLQELYFIYDAINKRSFKLVYTQDFIDKMIGTARDPFTSAQVEAFNASISELKAKRREQLSTVDSEYSKKYDELTKWKDEQRKLVMAEWDKKIADSQKQLEEFLKTCTAMMASIKADAEDAKQAS